MSGDNRSVEIRRALRVIAIVQDPGVAGAVLGHLHRASGPELPGLAPPAPAVIE